MHKPSLLSTALLLAIAVACGPARAATAFLDQDNWHIVDPLRRSFSSITPQVSVAQTFTAGSTGVLDSIHLQAIVSNPASLPTAPLGISIYELSVTGSILGPMLGQPVSIDPTDLNSGSGLGTARAIVDFASFDIEIVQSHQYVIVASMSSQASGSYNWYAGATFQNTYAGGQAYFMNPSFGVTQFQPYSTARDLGFQTYLFTPDVAAVPEPAPFALAGVATAVVILRRSKK